MILSGDAIEMLRTLASESVQCCVTSPPYWGLRDYGVEGQIGLETTPGEYVASLVTVFEEVRRVMTDDGTLWLNLGDSYAARSNGGGGSFMEMRGHTAWANHARLKGFRKAPEGLKSKDLVGIPWMTAFALRDAGWYLRSDIIWSKPNAMPESVKDRPTKSHEYIFLLSKSKRYYYDADAIRDPHSESSLARAKRGRSEDHKWVGGDGLNPEHSICKDMGQACHPHGRNKRTVWTVSTQPNKEDHFAAYPPKLVRPCILAGSRLGDTVIDPFNGTGTTGAVALSLRRNYIGIEINPKYVEITKRRLSKIQMEAFA